MPRPPAPPPTVTVVVDTSPAAQAAYLELIKYLLRLVEEDRARARTVEPKKLGMSIKM